MRIYLLLFFSLLLLSCKKKVPISSGFLNSAKSEYRNDAYIEGIYEGTWSDEGGKYPLKMEIFSFGGKNGNGILTIKKENILITGIIHINGKGGFINGSIQPSKEIRLLNEMNKQEEINIYTCQWSLAGSRLETDSDIMLEGKAVPQHCNDYAIASFEVRQRKEK